MEYVADIAAPEWIIRSSNVRTRTCVPGHAFDVNLSCRKSSSISFEARPRNRRLLRNVPKDPEQMFDSRAERPYDVGHDRSKNHCPSKRDPRIHRVPNA
jgi:hypothetical protein